MSYRKFDSLNPLDKVLRKVFPSGMMDGTQVIIEKFNGFEEFGHPETWADGYKITVPEWPETDKYYHARDNQGRRKVVIKKEYLDDAINELQTAMESLATCESCNYKFQAFLKTTKKCRECEYGHS